MRVGMNRLNRDYAADSFFQVHPYGLALPMADALTESDADLRSVGALLLPDAVAELCADLVELGFSSRDALRLAAGL